MISKFLNKISRPSTTLRTSKVGMLNSSFSIRRGIGYLGTTDGNHEMYRKMIETRRKMLR